MLTTYKQEWEEFVRTNKVYQSEAQKAVSELESLVKQETRLMFCYDHERAMKNLKDKHDSLKQFEVSKLRLKPVNNNIQ